MGSNERGALGPEIARLRVARLAVVRDQVDPGCWAGLYISALSHTKPDLIAHGQAIVAYDAHAKADRANAQWKGNE